MGSKDASPFEFKPRKQNLPPGIRHNIKIRHTLLKLKKKAETDLIRKAITKQYNPENHQVQQQLREFDQGIIEKLAEDVCQAENLSTMWKLFSKYKRNEEQAVEPECPLIFPDGQFTTSDEQKIAEFAKHMRMVHQTPENLIFLFFPESEAQLCS